MATIKPNVTRERRQVRINLKGCVGFLNMDTEQLTFETDTIQFQGPMLSEDSIEALRECGLDEVEIDFAVLAMERRVQNLILAKFLASRMVG